MAADSDCTDSLNTRPEPLPPDRHDKDLSTIGSQGPETMSFLMGPDASRATSAPTKQLSSPAIPGYEILGILGQGGMGIVYHARQRQLNREVALKMILGAEYAGETALARFQTEAQAIASLQHPNIVQLYDHGQYDNMPYFTLEYVRGGSLADHVREAALAAGEAARIARQLAEGIAYAHDKGILHRDLKPGNVLLASEFTASERGGESSAVPVGGVHESPILPKITDFGLAKRLDSGAEMTATGAVMGTPGYMAPEQAAGKKVGLAADIYALGAILYRLVAGRPPFQGATFEDLISQVMTDDPLPPSRLVAKVPKDLETICLKCLAREPEHRYATAHALAEDLRRFEAGEPILARPLGRAARLWRWCKRKPALAASLSIALIAATVAIVTFVGAFILVRASRDEAVKAAQQEMEARKEAEDRQRKAEILTVQVRFEQAYQMPEEKRSLSIVTSAKLLKEAIDLKDHQLEKSLRLHLGSWLDGMHHLSQLFPHKARTNFGTFSPDGSAVLIATEDGNVQRWEASSGTPIGPPLRHEDQVWTAVFSPDGKIVMTGCNNGTAQLWDVALGKRIGPPLPHDDKVFAVAFSPDGKIAATGSKDGTARLWDGRTGKPIGKPLEHKNSVFSVAFSPDSKTLLTGSADHTARLWTTDSRELVGNPMRHDDEVYAATFSSDGKMILTAGKDRTARLWDTATTNLLLEPLKHLHPVQAAAFSPDGRYLVTGVAWESKLASDVDTAQLWDTETGRPVGVPMPHRDMVLSVAFSPNGKYVLTGSRDLNARLWQVPTCKPIGPPMRHGPFARAAFSPDGKFVLTTGSDFRARLWRIARQEPLGLTFLEEINRVLIDRSADGRIALARCEDGSIQLWDVVTRKPLGPPFGNARLRFGEVPDTNFAVLSPDGKFILTGVHLWDGTKGKLLNSLELDTGGLVAGVGFSPDGKYVATSGRNHEAGDGPDWVVRVWEVPTGKPVGDPLPHAESVSVLAFGPNGRTLATGSGDTDARLWDLSTGKPIGNKLVHPGGNVMALAFSPDGTILATISSGNFARLWDARNGERIGSPVAFQQPPSAVAFDRDGSSYVVACEDGSIHIFETTTGKMLSSAFQWPEGKEASLGLDDRAVHLRWWSTPMFLWRTPKEYAGSPNELLLRVSVLTGLSMEDDGQRWLSSDEWARRRDQMEKLKK